MLEVEGLCAGYGRVPVLDHVSLAIAAGERVAVVGPNGVGKTTLLKALIGLIPVESGRIEFAGAEVTREPSHRRARLGLSYVPQGRELFANLSVRDNLRMGALGGALDESQALARVLALMPRLGPLLERAAGTLSGGEQQLVAIARALAPRPRLVLLDEPSEGIQPSLVEAILAVLRALADEPGAPPPALLVVEQNLDFVAALAGRALIMQRGRLVREVAPEALSDPEVTRALLGGGD